MLVQKITENFELISSNFWATLEKFEENFRKKLSQYEHFRKKN